MLNPFPAPFQPLYHHPPLIPPRVGSALRGRSPLQIRPTPGGQALADDLSHCGGIAAPMLIRLAEFEKIALARRIQRFIRVGSRLERGDP